MYLIITDKFLGASLKKSDKIYVQTYLNTFFKEATHCTTKYIIFKNIYLWNESRSAIKMLCLLFLLFLHFFLNRWAHNASVKCDRMRSQKIRRRPESCHAYHPQVNTHLLDGSQTCIARLPFDYNLSTHKIWFSEISGTYFVYLVCFRKMPRTVEGLWQSVCPSCCS